VIYLDLVCQWRQIAEEFEAIDKEPRKFSSGAAEP
jgi:hypothetical protein